MNNNVEIVKNFKQSRDVVFNAFSRAEALEKWLSPDIDSVTPTVLEFDFRVGGLYRISYRNDMDDSVSFLSGSYTDISEPGLLIFTWAWDSPDEHADVQSRVRVELYEELNSGTRMVLRHERLTAHGMAKRHQSGWENTLINLEEYVHLSTNQ